MVDFVIESAVKTAFGKTLDKPLPYRVVAKLFSDAAELRASGEWPNDADIVSYKNDDIKAKVRAAAIQQALKDAGIEKPTIENSQDVRLKTQVELFMAQKLYKTEAEALAAAKQLFGLA